MSLISFILDGQRVEVESGKTLLEAAQQYGVKIPTLCHDPRLKPTAACRLCLIEIEKARTPMPACNTLVTKDMVVKTTSEAIIESRKMALELLLSDHYGDCISPCQIACPAGIDIQGQLAFIANGQYLDALKLIKESNPLPLICGRVCPRFCEKKCRRNLIDGPVAINMTKRFVADMDLYGEGPSTAEVKPASGYRVAVVGGGPAGLTAAYYLALAGHSVGLFEASPALGGMLRYGIPQYRLPKDVLDKEIASITRLCREVKTNYILGKDFTVGGLKKQGYQAVFLALGAQNDQKMQIPGEDLPGVFSGIGFLRDVIEGKKIDMGGRVVVVGGGNTAIDAARTALRLGAQEVTLVYRRSRQEMPANAEEVEGAEDEGVKFQFLSNPVKLRGLDKVTSIESIKMALGAPDASGRRRPEPVAGSEFQIPVSAVIMAIGQSVDTDCLDENSAVCLGKRGGISVDEETLQTGEVGVFAGGDCTTGPATAVEAIGAGRKAAGYIDQYLLTGKVVPETKKYNCTKGEWDKVNKEEYGKIQRVERAVMPALKPAVRKNTFEEIDTGISLEDARKEAGRCLSCGCQDVFECKLRELSSEYKVDDKNFRGKRIYKIIKEDEHPTIARDRNKCILCGRCVRICAEVEGASALGFARRGIGTTVEPGLELPLAESTCDSCSQCISSCPTGAIVNKPAWPKPGPFKMKSVASVCPYCGVGCSVELNMAGGKLVYVSSGQGGVNTGNLCHLGAFEIDKLQPVDRAIKPLIKTKNGWQERAWQSALAAAAAGLLKMKNEHGSDSVGVLVSGMATNEEGYLARKLAKEALGTNKVGYLTGNGVTSLKSDFTFDEILKSDLIISYDCDLQLAYPIVALKIRQAVDQGQKLAVFSTQPGKLDSLAALKIKLDKKSKIDSLKLLLASLLQQNKLAGANLSARYPVESGKLSAAGQTQLLKLSQLVESSARITLVVDADGLSEEEAIVINDLELLLKTAKPANSGLIVMSSPGNARGLVSLGITSPILEGIETGMIKAILIVGKRAADQPPAKLMRKLAFSVLISPEDTGKGLGADVFLPGTTYAESEGTFTNAEGRVQAVRPSVISPIGRSNINTLVDLSAYLGYPMHYHIAQDVSAEIKNVR